MIQHTTITLAKKLSSSLSIPVKQVAICEGDYLLGKLQEKIANTPADQPSPLGFYEKLPAMSIIKTSIGVNKDSPAWRSVVSRHGRMMYRDDTTGHAAVLHILPLNLTYNISLLYADQDQMDKAEIDLLWFLEGGENLSIPVKFQMQGAEDVLPIEIKPPSARSQELAQSREYNWGAAKLYRLDLSLDVSTFALRSSLKPTILYINYKVETYDGIKIVEGLIDRREVDENDPCRNR